MARAEAEAPSRTAPAARHPGDLPGGWLGFLLDLPVLLAGVAALFVVVLVGLLLAVGTVLAFGPVYLFARMLLRGLAGSASRGGACRARRGESDAMVRQLEEIRRLPQVEGRPSGGSKEGRGP